MDLTAIVPYPRKVDSVAITLALTAGMIAAFNPCGFALLPAYLALFLGDQSGRSGSSAVGRALVVGAAVTGGFVFLFGVAGLLISGFAVQVASVTPYLTIVVGPLLAGLGAWLLSGRELTIRLPRWSASAGSGLLGMFVYGIVYATVSLSCTIPVFLVAVVGVFQSESFFGGVAVLLAYAAGMGLILTSLAVAMALARDGLLRGSRRVLPYLNRVSGALLIAAGLYLTWYGYVELRILSGDLVARGPIDTVARWSGEISTAIDANVALIVWAGLAVVALGAGVVLARRILVTKRGSSIDESTDESLARVGRKLP